MPAGIWHESEYEKLREYDADLTRQPMRLFMCHQGNGCICGGWLAAHNKRETLALRLHLQRVHESAWNYDGGGVALFESGNAAADHGIAAVENPSQAAVEMIEKIIAKRDL